MSAPAFVAEVSSNHGCDLARALAFVDAAADLDCAAVKFQQFRIRELFAPEALAANPALLEREAWELPEAFNAELSWSYNDIDLPGGAFEVHLGRLRVSYSFDPKRFIQALVQYNDRADLVAANLRFGWLGEAGTGFFLVYNEQQPIGGGESERQVIVKYSRLLQRSWPFAWFY